MTSVCKMNWISSSDEAINLFDYNYWHFKWVWKVWVQMAILLKFLIMQLCWKESCCIKVSNWTMIHIFYIHLHSSKFIYILSISLAHWSQQPISKLLILNFHEVLNQWEKDLQVSSCVYLLELGSSDQDSIQAAKPTHNDLTYFRWRFKRQRRGTFKNGVKRAP